MSKLVTFDQFTSANIIGSEPVPTTIKKGNETINYNEIKLSYNYGTEKDPIISDLFLELPKVQATGLRSKVEDKDGKNGPYKKEVFSMMIKFDLTNNETRTDNEMALAKLDELHRGSSTILGRCKGKVKMHDFDPSRPGGSFKNPVYWPRDEVSGEIIKGKNPNIWVKLRNFRNNKTLFTDLTGQIIDWKLLTDVDIEFVPLLHVEKIYVGSKASLQIHLASAIITKIVQVGTETRQMSTLERLNEKYGSGLADAVAAQLAEIRMNRQDQLHSSSQHSKAEFGDYGGAMHAIPTSTVSSGTSNPSTEPTSLQDFLSGAPPMSNVPSMQTVTSVPPSNAPVFPTSTSAAPVYQPNPVPMPRLKIN